MGDTSETPGLGGNLLFTRRKSRLQDRTGNKADPVIVRGVAGIAGLSGMSLTTSRDVMTTMSNFGVIPWQALHLIEKLSLLGLNTSVCNWILNFLTGRPQSVRSWNSFSSTTTLSTGAPQGCVLSPLLFTLLTHDCAAMHSSNHIVKFTDDTTMVGLISKNDESAYREEVQ
ncbi:hypothetical protein QTP70_007496 [Hemibagrus guttatus]|uniref:Reverse transcriptase domain-containing protein n=1 Tax=Hemibagrus guttatus TaxID=175788 RepID=A0AAE0V7G9_9TELE|nr:hypothetical protein QTP70_007496 [Hemibagrus guttatus]